MPVRKQLLARRGYLPYQVRLLCRQLLASSTYSERMNAWVRINSALTAVLPLILISSGDGSIGL